MCVWREGEVSAPGRPTVSQALFLRGARGADEGNMVVVTVYAVGAPAARGRTLYRGSVLAPRGGELLGNHQPPRF